MARKFSDVLAELSPEDRAEHDAAIKAELDRVNRIGETTVSLKTKKIAAILEAAGHTNVRVWWSRITGGNDDIGSQGEGWMFESEQSCGEDTLGLNFEAACVAAARAKP